MKTKLSSLILMLIASIGTSLASDTSVDGIWYNFDSSTQTAEVTYRGSYWGTLSKIYSGAVIIPSTVVYSGKTYNVTSIGDYAFYYCTGLTSVEIPNSVTSIGYAAFYNCNGLTSVIIPNSVTSIGDRAFDRCTGLTSIEVASDNPSYCSIHDVLFTKDSTVLMLYPAGKIDTVYMIPNSVTSIGDFAFHRCTGLTSVIIPNSVTSIGDYAFLNCTGLTSIEVASDNPSYCSINDVLFTKDLTVLIQYPAGKIDTVYIIPNNVTSIGNSAFYDCTGLTSVIISDGVTSIESYAFFDCTGLTSIEIPNSVQSIGSCAFCGCTVLTSITIPNSITSIGDYTFMNCTGLTSVEIPNSVTSIGQEAFYGCTGLTSITCRAVTPPTLGNSVFYNVNKYIPLRVPKSSINSYRAADQWKEFENIIDDRVIIGGLYYHLNGENMTAEITSQNNKEPYWSDTVWIANIPSTIVYQEMAYSVTSIESNAFYGCSGLTSVTIPNSVTSIGNCAFYGCTGLKEIITSAIFFDISEANWINYTSQLQSVEINSGEITDDAFGFIKRSYKTIRKLNLEGATNTTLADEAFKNFYNLDSLRLPSQLTEIGYMSVAECVNLKEMTIPATVQTIQQRAFENCRSIQTVTFAGSDLTEIGNWAFYNNHALQQISIPEGVTRIGDGAFYGCTYLDSLNLPSTLNYVGDNAFALCSRVRAIDVDAVVPPSLASKTFQDVSRSIPVRVPDASVTAYQSDIYWSEFNIIGQGEAPLAIETISLSDDDLNASADGKFIRDGRLYILRDGKTYTIQGQDVR